MKPLWLEIASLVFMWFGAFAWYPRHRVGSLSLRQCGRKFWRQLAVAVAFALAGACMAWVWRISRDVEERVVGIGVVALCFTCMALGLADAVWWRRQADPGGAR